MGTLVPKELLLIIQILRFHSLTPNPPTLITRSIPM